MYFALTVLIMTTVLVISLKPKGDCLEYTGFSLRQSFWLADYTYPYTRLTVDIYLFPEMCQNKIFPYLRQYVHLSILWYIHLYLYL